MAEIIAFEEFRKNAEQCEILALFRNKTASKRACKPQDHFDYPSCRPGISGNLTDLFEQANAVVMRHYGGDGNVPEAVAKKCVELMKALSDHAQPE